MSAAAIADSAGAPPAARGGKKKLIVILAAVLVLLGALGGGAVFYLKKKAAAAAAAAEAEGDEKPAEQHAAADKDHMVPPTYLPLDPFVVNLADRDSDRYAQIGITLEVQDPAFAERMKAYMPAVRNAMLMTITRKTSRELLDPNGKELLAEQLKRDAVRPMGIEIAEPEPVTEGASAVRKAKAAEDDEDEDPKPKKKKKKKGEVKNPVQQVNFSSFIIQ